MPSSAPPKTSQAGFQFRAGLDIDVFKKLVARFDSSFVGEAETAFRKAMMMCAQAQMHFCDVAAEAYVQNGNAAQLQSEIAALQQQLEQREKQGAALADARDALERDFTAYRYKAEQAERTAQTETATLRREIVQLQMASGQIGAYCHACEIKRRALAGVATAVIGWAWFVHRDWFAHLGVNAGEWHGLQGVLLAAAPLLTVFLHWHWLKFKRKQSWRSWQDNDVYRRIAARWNEFLRRLVMK